MRGCSCVAEQRELVSFQVADRHAAPAVGSADQVANTSLSAAFSSGNRGITVVRAALCDDAALGQVGGGHPNAVAYWHQWVASGAASSSQKQRWPLGTRDRGCLSMGRSACCPAQDTPHDRGGPSIYRNARTSP